MKKYNWNLAAEITNFIFTDQDGDVFESDEKPLLEANGWRGTGDCNWVVSSCKPFLGDWRESLEERQQ